MVNFIFSVVQGLLNLKSIFSEVISSFLLKRGAQTEVTNDILSKEISDDQNIIRRIIDVEKKEAEVAAQLNPNINDVNDINKWLLNSPDKN